MVVILLVCVFMVGFILIDVNVDYVLLSMSMMIRSSCSRSEEVDMGDIVNYFR